MALRIVQLTDCHLSADPETDYRGFDPRANLEQLLHRIPAWSPDLVLATGDLSEDGSEASYRWLAAALDRLQVPVLAIPGNHDDPAPMLRHFPATAVDAPLVTERGGWQLVLLNSAVPDEVPGRLDATQLERLDLALGSSQLPKLVALHHQPLPVGSAWIDRYPLLEPEAFWAVLDRHPAVRLVAWGHVHQDIRLERGDVVALGSPSSVCNSLPSMEEFTVDPAGPSCRWLILEEGGGFETGILAPE